jgi:hypothetical protein
MSTPLTAAAEAIQHRNAPDPCSPTSLRHDHMRTEGKWKIGRQRRDRHWGRHRRSRIITQVGATPSREEVRFRCVAFLARASVPGAEAALKKVKGASITVPAPAGKEHAAQQPGRQHQPADYRASHRTPHAESANQQPLTARRNSQHHRKHDPPRKAGIASVCGHISISENHGTWIPRLLASSIEPPANPHPPYAASPAGTRFGTRFSRQEPTSGQGNAGTDARFPSENRQIVVVGESPEPNGVQGVAGSNPAVPIR